MQGRQPVMDVLEMEVAADRALEKALAAGAAGLEGVRAMEAIAVVVVGTETAEAARGWAGAGTVMEAVAMAVAVPVAVVARRL